MKLFVAGLLVMGYSVASLFFLRFWRTTRDRLFLFFAGAFALLAFQRAGLAASIEDPTQPTWYYFVRLLAFLLFLVAIIDKNRSVPRR